MGDLLSDVQWERIAPLIPKPKSKPKGGRPPSDDRQCLEGILWILRTGARWKDLPPEFPSPSTCWRRLASWTRLDVWLTVWRAFLAELDNDGKLDWSEAFMDGTFAPAKKGGLASERHARVRGQSRWYWQTARVFLSECSWRPPTSPSRTSRRPRSSK